MPTIISHKKPWIPNVKRKTNKSWAHDPRYHTHRWRKFREHFLLKNPLCIKCKEVGKTIPATTVGHEISLSIDNSDNNFWYGKHIPLCKSCNIRQAQKDKRDGNEIN